MQRQTTPTGLAAATRAPSSPNPLRPPPVAAAVDDLTVDRDVIKAPGKLEVFKVSQQSVCMGLFTPMWSGDTYTYINGRRSPSLLTSIHITYHYTPFRNATGPHRAVPRRHEELSRADAGQRPPRALGVRPRYVRSGACGV